MKCFDIRLEKASYLAGETVKGFLDILTGNGIIVKNFSFSIYGREKTDLTVTMSERVEAFSENVILDLDLSRFVTYKQASINEDRMLEVPKGLREIPFEFVIPENALESYKGTYASITYGVNVKAERKWKPKINKELLFTVSNPAKTVSADEVVIEDRTNDNDVFVKLELEKNRIAPGEVLKGKLTVETTGDKKKINHNEILLTGSEYAVACTKDKIGLVHRRRQTLDRTTKIEKYKTNLEMKEGDSTMFFEIHIPKEAKRSYVGRYSEYFWEIDAKIDMLWAKDFHLKQIIEIA